MDKAFFLISVIVIAVLSSCDKDKESDGLIVENNLSPNILLVIADDLGLDACPGYDVGYLKPSMPVLEELSQTGIKFNNVWSNPTCSPTRSTIITGKYGIRTNILEVGDVLSTSEESLQAYIEGHSKVEYSQAVIGKWHLSEDEKHPAEMGVESFAGMLKGGVRSYYRWDFTENETTEISTVYTTTKFTDLAIDWTSKQDKPWFLWLAYNAPHDPFHLPPSDLQSRGDLPEDEESISTNPLPYYLASIEAMDSELGRLLDSFSDEVRENTIIIFIGDNGTPNEVAQEYNSRKVKGSVYQGGINVPMIISGKGVSRFGQTEDALINTTDLFSTIANITGISVNEIHDSKSFNNLLSTNESSTREYTYSEAEKIDGSFDYTIRNKTHKYISFGNGTEGFYDLTESNIDNKNLLSASQPSISDEEEVILADLKNEVNEIRK